eukprot:Blabericola_migrator_1__13177@NODE_904_length_6135_cov_68_019281_g633_i0_p3_GENE_NODE_904_length_6135_cov_68_019281_g633_i0NODE_904_length_6135_cov_68_019281_g633_i0_p3_ORF_typecomplete_len211_score14_30C2/PF00168_30/0_00096C2C2_1/PF11618_8/0_031_NODE_904_length_6135_cov_68_019281_g633_i042924924
MLNVVRDVVTGQTPVKLRPSDYYCQPNGTLPQEVVLHIGQCRDLYKPTYLAKVKMDPYAAAYLQGKIEWRVKTAPVKFGGSNATIDKEIRLAYAGEPLVIIQIYIKEPIRDELIGQCPLDLLPLINSHSRRWAGPVTLYGKKGTVVHGQVDVSITLKGGSPYDPRNPACTVGQMQRAGGVFDRFKQPGSPYRSPQYNSPQYRPPAPFCCC